MEQSANPRAIIIFDLPHKSIVDNIIDEAVHDPISDIKLLPNFAQLYFSS